jgi:hypothetical protein
LSVGGRIQRRNAKEIRVGGPVAARQNRHTSPAPNHRYGPAGSHAGMRGCVLKSTSSLLELRMVTSGITSAFGRTRDESPAHPETCPRVRKRRTAWTGCYAGKTEQGQSAEIPQVVGFFSFWKSDRPKREWGSLSEREAMVNTSVSQGSSPTLMKHTALGPPDRHRPCGGISKSDGTQSRVLTVSVRRGRASWILDDSRRWESKRCQVAPRIAARTTSRVRRAGGEGKP